MEHVSTFSLVFITLIKLCTAEVPGSWYSANVINDGEFSPKPISEIFNSTKPESSFSTANPIIVLPSSTEILISTSSPETISTSYSTTPFSSEYVSTTPSPQTISFMTTQQTQPDPDSVDQHQPYLTNPLQMLQQPIIPQQNPPPNYFLIYQQAPQTVQNLPPSAPQELPLPSPSSSVQPEISTQPSTFSTFPSTEQQSLSTFQSNPSSTVLPELSTPLTSFSTSSPTVSDSHNLPSTLSTFQPSSDSTFPPNLPIIPLCSTPARSNDPTCLPAAKSSKVPIPLEKFPTLRIRMIAPSGSIMNVNVNPTVSPTTKRTTTTRRPTTTKTHRTKRNRNSYDACIRACEGKKAPICASPLSVTPIDPDALKGFPSICHMACHNSFRKNKYEMLVEGRCGRLRTRIHSVDSDSKLKKVELNKAQYTIVKEPQAVFEFSALSR